ncbi:MAG TPA: signal peptidase II [Rhizomicrobium sp.]
MTPRDLGLACAAGALALDQGSKLVLLYGFHFIEKAPGESVPVLPFFNLVMVWNPGVSYGLLPAHGPASTAVLAVFSVLAVVLLGWWLWRAGRRILGAALGLVIGGAIGNLVDRVVYGRVADFFHFYVHAYDWYVFNIADCAITLGVAALLYDAVLRPQPQTAGSQTGSSE